MSRKHLICAAFAALGLRLFFAWRFPYEAGDTHVYEEFARNWMDHGVYGLFVDGALTPVDVRAPGYPAFLAGVYALFGRTRLAVMLVQAVLDVATCCLAALIAARLAPESARQRVATAAMWLAALCPFVANYAATPLTEVLATFFTTLAILLLLKAASEEGTPARGWLAGGFVAGLGTLVRPESPLLLAAAGLALAWRWRARANWPRLARAGLWLMAGFLLPLLPWAARNWHTLGRVQFLAPRYAEMPDEYVPRGFYAWTKTWLVSFEDVYRVVWRLEDEPIRIEDVSPVAFDSAEERQRVGALLEQYNKDLSVTPQWDAEFAQLAGERTARHPLRTYVTVPLRRTATVWFTPRIELLPYSGGLWPPGGKWEEDPVDFSVTLSFGALNFLYVWLALAGALRCRRNPELALLAVFILLRTAFVTTVETPEPRYVVVCFPALLAIAAQVWVKRSA